MKDDFKQTKIMEYWFSHTILQFFNEKQANFSYGSYEEIQCDEQYCWCVDTEGRELQGTRTAEDVSPDCTGRTPNFTSSKSQLFVF